ncbi:MAG: hypothetical protein GY822_28220 [Deltaproteobacteria bacterium]|nr:hypothetical protein [Deltaproteobacteria bacterium]
MLMKSAVKADARGLAAYKALLDAPEFDQTTAYDDVKAEEFDAILLPGGHAPGMKPYLESATLQEIVLAFFDAKKSVAAICHGVVVLART